MKKVLAILCLGLLLFLPACGKGGGDSTPVDTAPEAQQEAGEQVASTGQTDPPQSGLEETEVPEPALPADLQQGAQEDYIGLEIPFSKISLGAEHFDVAVANYSPDQLETGENYWIERREGDGWSRVPLDFDVDDLSYEVPQNSLMNFRIYLYPGQYDYQPGEYRICKTVWVSGQEAGEWEIAAEFAME